MPSYLKDIEIPNPLKDSHHYYNKLLYDLYEEIYDVISPIQFKEYVINQRVIRWKVLSSAEKIEKNYKRPSCLSSKWSWRECEEIYFK